MRGRVQYKHGDEQWPWYVAYRTSFHFHFALFSNALDLWAQ